MPSSAGARMSRAPTAALGDMWAMAGAWRCSAPSTTPTQWVHKPGRDARRRRPQRRADAGTLSQFNEVRDSTGRRVYEYLGPLEENASDADVEIKRLKRALRRVHNHDQATSEIRGLVESVILFGHDVPEQATAPATVKIDASARAGSGSRTALAISTSSRWATRSPCRRRKLRSPWCTTTSAPTVGSSATPAPSRAGASTAITRPRPTATWSCTGSATAGW
jgi:hypothetical protein